MRTVSRCACTVVFLCLGFDGIGHAAVRTSGKPWTVQDSIAVRYFVTDFLLPGNIPYPKPGDEPARFSPDGRYFLFVSLRGDLARDHTVYTLWIYETAKVRGALAAGATGKPNGLPPFRKLVMRSGYPGAVTSAAIYLPVWESNGAITFVGTEGRESRRVYRYDVELDRLTALTAPQYFLPESAGKTYAIRGSTIVFETISRDENHGLEGYPMSVIGRGSLGRAYDPQEQDYMVYHVSYQGAPARKVAEATIGYGLFGPWISPDEKWAVMVYPPKDAPMPAEWSAYTMQAAPYLRFMLINLQTGLTQPVFDAPAGPWASFNVTPDNISGTAFEAFWASDNRHVLLLNAALPLDPEHPERRGTTYVVDYDVESAQWAIVDSFASAKERRLDQAIWLKEGQHLLFTYQGSAGKPTGSKSYRFDGQHWSAAAVSDHNEPVPSEKPRGLLVRIKESANDPPRVVASDGKREVTLTDADPALQDIWRAPVETIHWMDPDGNPVESLLMLPRGFSTSKPVPLVIQLSDNRNPPSAFRPDGEPGTGFAAQALAAQGFAVLQTEPAGSSPSDVKINGTESEGPAQVRRVDAAVAMLKKRGVVEDSPIGLIGFSRSGYAVHYVLTHPGRIRVGAAVEFDAGVYGYGDYILLAAFHGADESRHYGSLYGGGSFWENKKAWLDAPTFNLDRLTTPILFTINGPPIYALETVGAFELARRPFEYQSFADSPHMHQAPRQKEASMQATVDWMNFWLLGREREAADIPDRFPRWWKLKSDWQKVQAEEAAARMEKEKGRS